jgi:hypothetical protein
MARSSRQCRCAPQAPTASPSGPPSPRGPTRWRPSRARAARRDNAWTWARRRAHFELVVVAPEGRGSLDIITTLADGSPWVGAHVQVAQLIEDEEATPGLEPVYLTVSATNGRAYLEGLTPGSYAISVAGDGKYSRIHWAEIENDVTATVHVAELE